MNASDVLRMRIRQATGACKCIAEPLCSTLQPGDLVPRLGACCKPCGFAAMTVQNATVCPPVVQVTSLKNPTKRCTAVTYMMAQPAKICPSVAEISPILECDLITSPAIVPGSGYMTLQPAAVCPLVIEVEPLKRPESEETFMTTQPAAVCPSVVEIQSLKRCNFIGSC
jgi:hypothetical protein